jgi:hypothetical protein
MLAAVTVEVREFSRSHGNECATWKKLEKIGLFL